MTIITLIVTPLVMNIIRKARVSADKRSIDAYGRSIELAIASYLLDTGTFPTEISELTIEYSGDEVVCSITQLNGDSSVYLAECTVGGRTVNYSYGTDKSPSYPAYNVGEEVTYNGVSYYVIKDSGVKEQAVTLLKAEPLTVDEVNEYGIGHIYDSYYNATSAENENGYGVMVYYSSEMCRAYQESVCTTDYDKSEIKYVVDAWAYAKAPAAREARLITIDEYSTLTVEEIVSGGTEPITLYIPQYDWIYNNNYSYWTMSAVGDSSVYVYCIKNDGNMNSPSVHSDFKLNGPGQGLTVRPVIVLPKSTLISS